MTWQEFRPEGTTGEHPAGVFYRSSITGPQGAHYELLREKHHTGGDTMRAKKYLRTNFDVVSISVVREE